MIGYLAFRRQARSSLELRMNRLEKQAKKHELVPLD
jgi:hypothetical protein